MKRVLLLVSALSIGLLAGCVPQTTTQYSCSDCALLPIGNSCNTCGSYKYGSSGDDYIIAPMPPQAEQTEAVNLTYNHLGKLPATVPASTGDSLYTFSTLNPDCVTCVGTPGICEEAVPIIKPMPAYRIKKELIPVKERKEIVVQESYIVKVPVERDIEVPAMRIVPRTEKRTVMVEECVQEKVVTQTKAYRLIPRTVAKEVTDWVDVCITNICDPSRPNFIAKCPKTRTVECIEYDRVPFTMDCVSYKTVIETVPKEVTETFCDEEYYFVPAKTIECVDEVRTRDVIKIVEETVMIEVEKCVPNEEIALAIEMEDSKDPVFVGDEYHYTIYVANQGAQRATEVRVLAELDDSMDLISSSGASVGKMLQEENGPIQVEFAPLPILEAGTVAEWVVTVKAKFAEDARFYIKVNCAEKPRPIEETESTTIAAPTW